MTDAPSQLPRPESPPVDTAGLGLTIGGRQVRPDASFAVIDPSTGDELAAAPLATLDHLEQAMAAASEAQRLWADRGDDRSAHLNEAAAVVAGHVEELAELITAEQGKPIGVARREVAGAAARLEYFAALEIPVEVLQDDRAAHVELRRRALGVVAAICPWNFPLGLAMWKLAPALKAGNTVVLKPSPITPLATLRAGELLGQVFPPGVVNVLSGGDDLGRAMTAHRVPRKVSFTGSIGAGKLVNSAAASDLKRVTLELGGNDPAIVLDDVDVAAAAPKLFWSAFMNSGQACAAVKRVYVPDERHDELVDALCEIARSVVVGDPRDEATQLGPLSDDRQLERVEGLVRDAIERGAKPAAGGNRIDRPGFFYEPTILVGASDGMPVVDEEQFGPVLPVVRYRDLDDAVKRANNSHYGLGSSIWGSDTERASGVAGKIEAGMTWVNGHAASPVTQPFGGVKWSGLGVENGPWGLLEFTDMHLVHIVHG